MKEDIAYKVKLLLRVLKMRHFKFFVHVYKPFDTRIIGQGAVDLPDLPVPDGTDIYVQLHNSDGECWGASFTGEPRRNTRRVYDAVSD